MSRNMLNYMVYRGHNYAKCSDGSFYMGCPEYDSVSFSTEKEMQDYIDSLFDSLCCFCKSAIDLDSEWGEIRLSPNKENSSPMNIRLCEKCFGLYSFSLLTKLHGDLKIGDLR